MRGKILFGFIISILSIISVGYYSYKSLSGLVNSLNMEARPNSKLLNLKELTLKLGSAEASVQAFSITGNPQSLNLYYQSIADIDGILLALNMLSFSDSEQYGLLDSLEILLESEFRVLNNLIELKQDDETKNLIEEFLANIKDLHFEQEEVQLSSNTISDTVLVVESNVITDLGNNIKEDSKPGKRSIFQRLFGSKKRKEKELEKVDSLESEKPVIAKDSQLTESREPITIKTPNPNIQQELTKTISRIQKEREIEQLELSTKELAFFTEKELIAASIRLLLDKFEALEYLESKKRAELAESLRVETINQVTIIILSTFLIIAILLIIVFRDIKKSNKQKGELNKAKLDAEKLAKVKQEFLSNISHEIRTPMNAVVGFADQLEKTQLNKDQEHYLNAIRNSSGHLLFLLNDVLDYSKLEAGKLDFEQINFSLNELIDEVVLYFKQVTHSKSIYLKIEKVNPFPAFLNGDPFRLKQILINLVGNAIKFTEKGGVTIKIHCVQKNETVQLSISINDTGIGIPLNKQKEIFQNFTQVDSSVTRKYGGTGLGLTISKKLIELQGGRIEVESKVGLGSKFKIFISYKIGKDSQHAKDPDLMQLNGCRILVVDDEKYNQILFKKLIEGWRANATLCSSGAEALNELKKASYDLVLMDLQMPEMDGMTAAGKIKNEINPEIPIIALTATQMGDGDLKEYFDGYLLKPVSEQKLWQLISSVAKDQFDLDPIDYDLTELSKMGEGDPDFINSMVHLFIKNSTKNINELELAYKNKNWEELSLLAHKMIPPCRHLNLKKIVRWLKKVELEAEIPDRQLKLDEIINSLKITLIEVNKGLSLEFREKVKV